MDFVMKESLLQLLLFNSSRSHLAFLSQETTRWDRNTERERWYWFLQNHFKGSFIGIAVCHHPTWLERSNFSDWISNITKCWNENFKVMQVLKVTVISVCQEFGIKKSFPQEWTQISHFWRTWVQYELNFLQSGRRVLFSFLFYLDVAKLQSGFCKAPIWMCFASNRAQVRRVPVHCIRPNSVSGGEK